MGSIGIETSTYLSSVVVETSEPPARIALSTTVAELRADHGKSWQDVAQRRREEINNAIPREYIVAPNLFRGRKNLSQLPEASGILDARELEITSLTAMSLLKLIHDQTYTAVEVAKAFCKRAAIAHQATNCLAWIMFDSALERAAVLDSYMEKHGKPVGPLHGLPISVKEHIYFADTPSTSGFVAWADSGSETDALVVKILRKAGAVFHCKTTNPQALMALETTSNLYGTTTNPYNIDLTPGGSSGGEGALIAMKGSLLGIGTDIGGSIRAPAAFSGIYGLKPSVARLPHGGLAGVHGGMENIIGVVGPIATCVEDMQLFCEVVLESEPWLHEPTLVEKPWNGSLKAGEVMRIGVMYDDNVVHPHPPISAALENTVAALERAGHEVVRWEQPSLQKKLVDAINQAYFLDTGEEYHEVLANGNEPPTELMAWLLDAAKANRESWTVRDTWKLNKEIDNLKIEYAKEWNEARLDCLLLPANPSVASAHGESKYWGYTSAFNLLDYCGTVFPVGTVHSSHTWENYPSKKTLGQEDLLFKSFYSGPEKYKDAPINLQLVARRYREESILLMTGTVVEALKNSKAVDV